MKNNRRIIYRVLFFCTIALVVYSLYLFLTVFLNFTSTSMPSKEDVEKDWQRYKTEFSIIVDYLAPQIDASIYIADVNDPKKTYVNDSKIGRVETIIDDQNVIEAINCILENDIINVISGNSAKSIEFQTWSTLNKGCGITYSFDGSKPDFQFVVKLEPLSDAGWYYYISDFDEYRRRQQAQ